MKKILLIGGLIIALLITFNAIRPDVYERTTVVAGRVQEIGNSWYVDEKHLDKAFKHGIWNPKTGRTIELKLDCKERVVEWKVKR